MEHFHRYTNLAATIHMLSSKTITLLNPATWDDKNDAYFMAEYKRYKSAKAVLALCFAETSQTYHHWRVFSHGSDGVCIDFDKERLLSTFAKDKRIQVGTISYKSINYFGRIKRLTVSKLPFTKRDPFRDEREYRVVYVDTEEAKEHMDYPIVPRWIRRITLSPWMPKALERSTKNLIRSIDGCSGIAIYRSTLIDNERWKGHTAQVRK